MLPRRFRGWPLTCLHRVSTILLTGSGRTNGCQHGKLGCVYAVTITAMSILLLREKNFQVLVILKWEMNCVDFCFLLNKCYHGIPSSCSKLLIIDEFSNGNLIIYVQDELDSDKSTISNKMRHVVNNTLQYSPYYFGWRWIAPMLSVRAWTICLVCWDCCFHDFSELPTLYRKPMSICWPYPYQPEPAVVANWWLRPYDAPACIRTKAH